MRGGLRPNEPARNEPSLMVAARCLFWVKVVGLWWSVEVRFGTEVFWVNMRSS